METEVGSIVEGVVVEVVKYGAFVKMRNGKTGLVHISQISNEFVREITDHISPGVRVMAKIVSIDDRGRIQLSLKNVPQDGLSEGDQQGEPPDVQRREVRRTPPRYQESREEDSFERKLKMFMRQSEDRMVDIKRNIESKRGIKKKKNKNK
ncbi:MAG TPA: S1 RNA-binding domain-containing protein [bacterium]|nr:S1 RNA-binding domain-containing protein [bacterium]